MLRLSTVILAVVAIYSLFSATAILVRLRSIMNPRQSKDVAALQRSVASLHARSANIRQLVLATFYLFGIVFFFGLRFSYSGELLPVFRFCCQRVLYLSSPAFSTVVCVWPIASMCVASERFAR